MIFGAKLIPTSANYCLKRTAIDNQNTSSEETTSAVLREFYMDDLLKSLPSEDETTKLALQLIELLSKGGFRLTKFMSNSRYVLAQPPPKDITAICFGSGQPSSCESLGSAVECGAGHFRN